MKIALTNTGDREKHGYYVQWLQQEDPAIEVIKLDATLKNAHRLDECDGLLLSGGVDVHPSLYRGNATYDNAPKSWDRERDEFEAALLRKALDRYMPVLAICRGLQLVNVVLGGKLVQDLGILNKTHEGGYEDKRHPIGIAPHTLLHELAPEGKGEVNSAHHQAIDTLATGLQPNAHAADGTIEGIEWKDKNRKAFLLGVQWHPERMFMFQLGQTPASQRIRDRFIEEIQKYKSGQR